MRRLFLRLTAAPLAGVVVLVPRAVVGRAIDVLRVLGERVANALRQISIGLINPSA